MIVATRALSQIPADLRNPLIDEYNNIIQNYMERRWSPAELSGGRFCEIVYTIISGFASGTYLPTSQKPQNFVLACRNLENNTSVPRSFQILIPRILPALYEIRNNRNVGHIGGDVDPNHMDATAVVSMSSWIMGELVRVFHKVSVQEAQEIVDSLVERRIPLVWNIAGMKRVLDPNLSLKDQILLLISSSPTPVLIDDLFLWCDYNNRQYFAKTLRQLHKIRFLELSTALNTVQILPPGSLYISQLIAARR
jgi:hypothetical protein